MFQKNIVLGFGVIAMSAGAHAVTSDGITRLQDLAEMARTKSKLTQSANHTANSKALSLEAISNGRLPKLRFESAHGAVGLLHEESNAAQPSEESGFSSSFSLGIAWTAYDGGEHQYSRQIADVSAQTAKLQVESVALDLLRKLAQQYFQVVASQIYSTMSTSLEKTLKTQYAAAERQFRQGLKPRKDFQRISAELKRAQLEGESRQRQIEVKLQQLARTVGVSVEEIGRLATVDFPKSSREIELPAVSSVAASVIANKMDDATLQSARLTAERSSRKVWMPEVQFSVNAQYGADQYVGTGYSIADRDSLRWSAILSVNMDIWDWGIKRLDSEAQWENYRAIAANLASSREDRDLQYLLAKASLSDLLNQFDLARELLDIEEENFSNIELDFRQGRAGYLELINALRDLSASRRQMYEAYFEIQDQLIDVRHHEGTLDEWIKTF